MQIAILSFFHYFSNMFKKRESIFEVEEGKFLSPKFDGEGLIPVITTDYKKHRSSLLIQREISKLPETMQLAEQHKKAELKEEFKKGLHALELDLSDNK